MITDMKILSHVASMNAIMIKVEAMKANNMHRISRGETIGYSESHFWEAEKEMLDLAFTFNEHHQQYLRERG